MEKEEEQAFNAMLMNIARNKKRKFLETAPNEHTAMVPLGEVLSEIRRFVKFVKLNQIKK